MTSTLTRSRDTNKNTTHSTTRSDIGVVSLAPPTAKRPSWVIAGAVLVGLAALLGAYVFNAATDTIRVTVAADSLAPGEVIGPEDLRVVEMGRTGDLRAIVADQQHLVIGLTPRAVIPAGTLLNTDLFIATDEVIPAGMSIVGASLRAGEIPTATLSSGATVGLLVVASESPGLDAVSADQPSARLIGEATVWAISGTPSTDGLGDRAWVSLLVDAELQVAVADAAATERLRLTLVES